MQSVCLTGTTEDGYADYVVTELHSGGWGYTVVGTGWAHSAECTSEADAKIAVRTEIERRRGALNRQGKRA